ncbi:MAG: hypothetical protein R2804_14980 [Cyclobacteriaceae bacterium]|jgi:hypothetical protein
MTQTFTQDDLIRYIYHETTEKETREIDRALICDSELQKQYKELVTTKKQLDTIRMEPSERTINGILNYARGLQEKH